MFFGQEAVTINASPPSVSQGCTWIGPVPSIRE